MKKFEQSLSGFLEILILKGPGEAQFFVELLHTPPVVHIIDEHTVHVWFQHLRQSLRIHWKHRTDESTGSHAVFLQGFQNFDPLFYGSRVGFKDPANFIVIGCDGESNGDLFHPFEQIQIPQNEGGFCENHQLDLQKRKLQKNFKTLPDEPVLFLDGLIGITHGAHEDVYWFLSDDITSQGLVYVLLHDDLRFPLHLFVASCVVSGVAVHARVGTAHVGAESVPFFDLRKSQSAFYLYFSHSQLLTLSRIPRKIFRNFPGLFQCFHRRMEYNFSGNPTTC
ncbi:urocanate hydratase [Thermotoga neapolitana DSM 4359]|uniref:Urocanate hydratase n=1 Tax=Thermotoga neapolitana (strain ATCC 49049 / DSM 4359 / NBRC 107923 / NS-E) TaxID=309803 RepID=B9K715_THENN|nr:urocanate hydratase [Thermotoga neapolitana DSM 4359]